MKFGSVSFTTQSGEKVTVDMERENMRLADGSKPNTTQLLQVVYDPQKYIDEHRPELSEDFRRALVAAENKFADIEKKMR